MLKICLHTVCTEIGFLNREQDFLRTEKDMDFSLVVRKVCEATERKKQEIFVINI